MRWIIPRNLYWIWCRRRFCKHSRDVRWGEPTCADCSIKLQQLHHATCIMIMFTSHQSPSVPPLIPVKPFHPSMAFSINRKKGPLWQHQLTYLQHWQTCSHHHSRLGNIHHHVQISVGFVNKIWGLNLDPDETMLSKIWHPCSHVSQTNRDINEVDYT